MLYMLPTGLLIHIPKWFQVHGFVLQYLKDGDNCIRSIYSIRILGHSVPVHNYDDRETFFDASSHWNTATRFSPFDPPSSFYIHLKKGACFSFPESVLFFCFQTMLVSIASPVILYNSLCPLLLYKRLPSKVIFLSLVLNVYFIG